ncbi:hypothetical protein, partial [Kitasatospora sp. NPDC057541]|uniref:hypothetical protein n=1 Tax=Kitasatospora sp. NPDC057541 TaxID=3346161 RepID=UPI0036C9FC4A
MSKHRQDCQVLAVCGRFPPDRITTALGGSGADRKVGGNGRMRGDFKAAPGFPTLVVTAEYWMLALLSG